MEHVECVWLEFRSMVRWDGVDLQVRAARIFPASFVEYSTIGRHGDERDIMPNLCRHTGSDLGALNPSALANQFQRDVLDGFWLSIWSVFA